MASKNTFRVISVIEHWEIMMGIKCRFSSFSFSLQYIIYVHMMPVRARELLILYIESFSNTFDIFIVIQCVLPPILLLYVYYGTCIHIYAYLCLFEPYVMIFSSSIYIILSLYDMYLSHHHDRREGGN